MIWPVKRAMIALTFAAVAVLAGCAGGPAPALSAAGSPASPSASPSRPTEAAGTPTPSNDPRTLFLLNVRHSPTFEPQTDEVLLGKADAVCAALDHDGTYEDAVAPLLTDGATADDALVLAASAVFWFCDQHDQIIEVQTGGVANPAPDPTGSSEDAYLAVMRADPFYAEADDDLLIMIGTTYCDGFTRGDSLEVALGYTEPTLRSSAMVMLTAATTYICPQHAAIVAGR